MMKKTLLLFVVGCLLAVSTTAAAQSKKSRREERKALREMLSQNDMSVMPILAGSCRFDMLLVHGGSYMMGCDPEYWNGIGKMDEMPRHAVEVKSFYLAQYEVTQRLWTEVMGYNPSNFQDPDLPVEQVSYNEVVEFISKLNAMTHLRFRLPTEAEWEYAARGGHLSEGRHYAGSNNIMQVGWSQLNSGDSTHYVGGLVPNELGLYDMTGNVWEWCSDWYDADQYIHDAADCYDVPPTITQRESILKYFAATYIQDLSHECTRETTNPQGAESGQYKVGRGGSWADESINCRLAYRNFWTPDTRLSNLGFRLALADDDIPAAGWMPNQYIVDSVVGGTAYQSMTPDEVNRMVNGVLEGVFSVSDSQQVRFAKGNLQYNAKGNKWRLANHQYDIIGEDNIKLSQQYSGWIDLFAFGTSGYRNRPPYYFSTNNAYYGNGSKNLDGTSYDWGVNNRIIGGGEKVGLWRTLSVNEWAYLLLRRPNAPWLRTVAKVNNVQGIVLLPDNWLKTTGDTLDIRMAHIYTAEEWTTMERRGAVFLPCAGYAKLGSWHAATPLTAEALVEGINVGYGILMPQSHRPASAPAPESDGEIKTIAERDYESKVNFRPAIESDECLGYYWTTVQYDKNHSLGLCFSYGTFGYILPLERMTRLSVRLVQNVR